MSGVPLPVAIGAVIGLLLQWVYGGNPSTKTDFTKYKFLFHDDVDTQEDIFEFEQPNGWSFYIRVSQRLPLEQQKRNLLDQLYEHARRIADKEMGNPSQPHVINQRADEILLELHGMINKTKKP